MPRIPARIPNNRFVFCDVFVLAGVLLFLNAAAQTSAGLSADVYASYFGGTMGEHNIYIATDSSGNVILAGHTYSSDIPVQSALQTANKLGPCDGFVAKLNPAMTELIFSTYLGGSLYDEIKDVVTDAEGNIIVTGLTESGDFPVTDDAFQRVHSADNGGTDAFITKLNPQGQLVYSTFLGGSAGEIGYNLVSISPSVVCLAGGTSSRDFPCRSAFRDTLGGENDVFVTELNMDAAELVFSTYLGGLGDDEPLDMTVDGLGRVFVCGSTRSADFSIRGSERPAGAARQDGFITCFEADGGLVYSRLIGGSLNDAVAGIEVNERGDVFFVGNTNSTGLACTENAFFPRKIGSYDILLGELDAAGDSLLYFSYFGGRGSENVLNYGGEVPYHMGRIRRVGREMVVVTGITASSDFPLTDSAYDRILQGDDAYVTVLDLSAGEILYSTRIGGSGGELINDLWVPDDSTVFISGGTGATDFPVSPDGFRKTNRGSAEAIFARFRFSADPSSGLGSGDRTPDGFSLRPNFPNPFNPRTMLSYSLASPSRVQLAVFDVRGRRVRLLVDEAQSAGHYSASWDGRDDSGGPAGSGVYFCRVRVDGMEQRIKMALVR